MGQTPIFSIIEVYYDKRGKIKAWTDIMSPAGEDLDGLRADYDLMGLAFGRPVLDGDKLDGLDKDRCL